MKTNKINNNEGKLSLSTKDKEKIEYLKYNCICKLFIENYQPMNGFLCKIPYKSNFFTIIITSNQEFTQNKLDKIKSINIITNNRKKYKIINIDNNRNIFIDIKRGLLFIEIKPNDKINHFFELEDNCSKDNKLFEDTNLSILFFQNKNIIAFYKDLNNIIYNIKDEFLFSPILLLENLKIIGIINKNFINNINLSASIKDFILYITNKKEKLNELTIIYDINNINYDIKIFDDLFVSNNKNNCKLLIKGKEKDLCEHLTKNEININNSFLEIKLIETKKITSMKYMFFGCSKLLSIPDFSKWNTENITDMSFMFYDCKSLKFLPDISKWNTSKVNNMLGMFKSCTSLITLPDISKWDTSNVCNMSCLFLDCTSLILLPDISKWDTSNIIVIDGMFYDCKSLSYLPDISKWNTQNITSLSYMFYGCESLLFIPDISKWKTNKIKNICWMFGDCKSLVYIPDFTEWNFSDIVFVNGVFSGCLSLLDFPDISKIQKNINKNRNNYKDNNLFKYNSSLFQIDENIKEDKMDDNNINKFYKGKYFEPKILLNIIIISFYIFIFIIFISNI